MVMIAMTFIANQAYNPIYLLSFVDFDYVLFWLNLSHTLFYNKPQDVLERLYIFTTTEHSSGKK